MSVRNAVLGLVIERPGYGYELTQRLNQRLPGLQLSEAAVYPALDSLERQGLVQRRKTAGRTARKRVWYESTPEGCEYFREWMKAPLELAPLRDPLIVKIAFATEQELPRLVEQTREHMRACLDRLEHLTRSDAFAEVVDLDADWSQFGRRWPSRTEARLLATQIETLNDLRAEMTRSLRRRDGYASAA